MGERSAGVGWGFGNLAAHRLGLRGAGLAGVAVAAVGAPSGGLTVRRFSLEREKEKGVTH